MRERERERERTDLFICYLTPARVYLRTNNFARVLFQRSNESNLLDVIFRIYTCKIYSTLSNIYIY